MKKNERIKLIKELSEVFGTSGFEGDVIKIIKDNAKELADAKQDSMHNLYLHRKGNDNKKLRVMLDSHSDEVGFIAKSINANGTIKFLPIGSWNTKNILGHSFKILNGDDKYITGVVGSTPPHFLTEAERNLAPTISSMYLDVGASSYKEAVEKFKIEIGKPISPISNFEVIEQNNRIVGKAFDCRLGCAISIETLKNLQDKKLDIDLVATISTQEEMGLRGAKVTADTVKPDIAIVLEASPADDVIFNSYEAQCVLDEGVQIRHFDRTMIANPNFIKFAKKIAKEAGIKVQSAVRSGGGTNAGAIHLANSGVPTLVLAVPTRYIHTHNGIASLNDFDSAVSLVTKIIENLNEDIIKSF